MTSISFSDVFLYCLLPHVAPAIKVSGSVLQVWSSKTHRSRSTDLCPKYTHASSGQECGPPKLLVRISGGLCIVYTAQWPGKWSLVLSDYCFFLRAVGARQEKRWTGRKCQSTNNVAHCLSNWQTVTGSWHILQNRGPRLGRGCDRRQHILLSVPEMFFIYQLQIPPADWKLSCLTKAFLLGLDVPI